MYYLYPSCFSNPVQQFLINSLKLRPNESYKGIYLFKWGGIQSKYNCHMENIVSVSGKLLYFARHLANTKQINGIQLAALKDMIIDNNDDVLAAYQEYITSGTELTLSSALIRLLRQQKDSESDGANSQGSRRHKRGGITIVIPKRNIQKMPAHLQRL